MAKRFGMPIGLGHIINNVQINLLNNSCGHKFNLMNRLKFVESGQNLQLVSCHTCKSEWCHDHRNYSKDHVQPH